MQRIFRFCWHSFREVLICDPVMIIYEALENGGGVFEVAMIFPLCM